MAGKVTITLTAETAEAQAKILQFSRATEDALHKIRAGDPILQSSAVRVTTLGTAHATASTATESWTRQLAALPGPLGQVGSRVDSLRGLLAGPAGLVGGLLAVGAGVLAMAKNFSDSIESLDNLSRQTGLSVASLQAFRQAAHEAGEEPDALVRGFGKVSEAVAEVLKGNVAAAASFRQVGVDLEGMTRRGASSEQILEAVARGLSRIEDPTRRAAAATDLFGVKGRAMTTVLDTIAKEGLGGYIAKMREAGIVTDEQTNAMAREFDALWDQLGRGMTGFLNNLKGFAVELVLTITNAAREAARGARQHLTEAEISGIPSITGVEGLHVERAPSALRADRERAGFGAPPAAPGVTFVGAPVVLGVRQQAGGLTETIEDLTKAIEAGFAQAAKTMTEDLDRLRKETDDARDSLTAYTPMVDDNVVAQLRLNEEINRRVTLQQSLIANTTDFLAVEGDVVDTSLKLGTALGKIERPVFATGEGFKLTGVEVEKTDENLQLLIDRVDEYRERVPSTMLDVATAYRTVRRDQEALLQTQIDAAKGAGEAWEVFGLSFKGTMAHAADQMAFFQHAGEEVARNLHQVFADSFFALMHGDLDALQNAWKSFLDALLRMIAEFLATETIRYFISVFTGQSYTFGGGGAGGGGGGGGGVGGAVGSVGTSVVTSAAGKWISGQLGLTGTTGSGGVGSIFGGGGTPAASFGADTGGATAAGAPVGAGVPEVGGVGASTGVGAAGVGATVGSQVGPASAAVGTAAGGAEAGAVVGAGAGAEGAAGGGAAAGAGGAAAATGVAAIVAVAALIAYGIYTSLTKDQKAAEEQNFASATASLVGFNESLRQGAVSVEQLPAAVVRTEEAFELMRDAQNKFIDVMDESGRVTEQGREILAQKFGAENVDAIVASLEQTQAVVAEQAGAATQAVLAGATVNQQGFDQLHTEAVTQRALLESATGTLERQLTQEEIQAQQQAIGAAAVSATAAQQAQMAELTQHGNEALAQIAFETGRVGDEGQLQTALSGEQLDAYLGALSLLQSLPGIEKLSTDQVSQFAQLIVGLGDNKAAVDQVVATLQQELPQTPEAVNALLGPLLGLSTTSLTIADATRALAEKEWSIIVNVEPIEGRQHGGYIPFSGPRYLHADEYVVNPAATRDFRPLLEWINAGGTLGPPPRTGPSARGTGPSARGTGEDAALMREQNALLREQNRLLAQIARRGGTSAAVL